jgi:hypothetical protein
MPQVETLISITITDRGQNLPPLKVGLDMMLHLQPMIQTAIYISREYRRLIDQIEAENPHDEPQG